MANKFRDGQCICRKPDPGTGTLVQCDRERVPPTWYCRECNAEWEATRTGNRDRALKTVTDNLNGRDRAGDLIRAQSGIQSSKGGGRVSGGGGGKQDWSRYETLVTSTTEFGSGARLVGSAKPACDNKGGGHPGRVPVVTFADGRTVFGAQGAKLNGKGATDHVQLVIDCAGVYTKGGRFVQEAPAQYQALDQGQAGPDVIRLKWPDLSAPWQVGPGFWARLYQSLPHATMVCCVGGHGRTGTAIACLLVASGMDPDLAILTVRTKHCRRAIETPEQEKYIRSLKPGTVNGTGTPAEAPGTHPAQVPPGDPDDPGPGLGPESKSMAKRLAVQRDPDDLDDPTMPRQTHDKGDR